MSEVEIYMYDISNGMARVMGPMFGVNIEAIWHTSVVAFGYEYFFAGGGGILREDPGTTPFGRPVEKRSLGRTRKTRVEFEDWNRSQGEEFGPDAYNLIEKNCNHYTDKALKYLVDQGVPDTVSNMTASIVSSPLGQIAMRFLESIQEGLANAHSQEGTDAAESSRGEDKYWCHMCDKEVKVTHGGEGVKCVECKNEFVEMVGGAEADRGTGGGSTSSTVNTPNELVQDLLSNIGRGIAALLQRFPQTPSNGSIRVPERVITSLPRTTLPSGCEDPCPICLDTFTRDAEVIFLPCNHFFHTPCIEQWLRLRGNCPECRREVPRD
eukprot:TRINITY_DN10803_c0_g1_i1.p1 TRINITY_DN10803_c0_g1~~TRINITY_DN10803_c0_g1_i1.p1  ORF type:complete len:324 (+),score=39.93 TRINITY_DN10803_c0_g1_i1:67-1038(+)